MAEDMTSETGSAGHTEDTLHSPSPSSELRRVTVLGVHIVAEPFGTVLAAILSTLRSGRREGAFVCPTGVHGLIEAQDDPALMDTLNAAPFTVADGMPLVSLARVRGCPNAERAFGPDLMVAIIEATQSW